MASISIVRSDDSYEGAIKALKLIRDELAEKIRKRRKVLIKPNFVSAFRELAATPRESVEAIIEFLKENFNISEIIIGESPAIGSFESALRNYGYHQLKEKHPEIQFIDLDSYDQREISLDDERGEKFRVYVSELMFNDDFIKISPCRAKTHDTVIVTLSIKNMVMGSIRRGYKSEMHRGYYSINYNIARLASKLMPDIGLIDGVYGMEGDGPVRGEPKKWGVILASINPVNLDVAASYAMGFDPRKIGYLYFLTSWGYGEIDPHKIRIVGEELDYVKTRFKPHRSYRQQLSWMERLSRRSA